MASSLRRPTPRAAPWGIFTAIALLALAAAPAAAQLPDGTWGIRGGAGTDINLGIAFGGQLNYQLERGTSLLEIGPTFFYSHSEEETVTSRTYNETTDLVVFGVMANWLFGYAQGGSAPYFVAGVGLAGISVSWEETSPDDSSLGTPFGPNGSQQSEDGTVGGSVVNVGVGYTFGEKADVRAELPMIVIFGVPGEASSVAPTFTVTVGVRLGS